MFKRFTDTDKWDRPWYRRLSPAEKCAWEYVVSKCDNVGVWIFDPDGAEFNIGESIDWDGFRERCNGNISIIDGGKWWVSDFCRFQYGELHEESNSPTTRSYIKLLKNHRLWIAYSKGMDTLQDKDKDKEKDKDKDKEKREKINALGSLENVHLSETELSKLDETYGEHIRSDYVERLSTWKPNAQRKVKNDYATLLTWIRKDKIPKLPPKESPCPLCGGKVIDGQCRNAECPQYGDGGTK